MPTLNATVFPDEAYVLVEVDWTDVPEVEYATVTRRNTVTGEIVTLRPYISYDGDGNLLLDCGLGLWWDTEPPLNVPLEYCTVAADVPANRVQNCCFPTPGVVAPWSTVGSSTFNTSAVFVHEGIRSAIFVSDNVSTNPSIFQAATGFVGSDPITISTWILAQQGWNAVWMQLAVVYTDATSETFQTPIEILDDAEWRLLKTTFTPRTTISSAVASIVFGGIPPNTVNFFVDEIYVTQQVDVAATACETVTVSSESVWLKNPFNPCLDVEVGLCSPMLQDCEEDTRVSYVGTSAEDYTPNTALLAPINRRRPIAINRVRRDAAATLQLLTHDCEARDAVLETNEPGDPLLFQAPATYCIPDRYISVGVLNEARLSVDQREDFRLITLPYVVVDRPVGPANGVCGARIDDLCDIYSSWAALTIAGFTWTDLLLGEASPNGPGQPDPPAGARTWDDVEAEFTDWDDVEAGGTRTWDELRDGL